jgi:hypothetical protein
MDQEKFLPLPYLLQSGLNLLDQLKLQIILVLPSISLIMGTFTWTQTTNW